MASKGTVELDFNNPFLYSEKGKKRKQEIILEFLQLNPKLQQHALSCPMKDGKEGDCEICQKFLGMINILLQEEQKKNMKLDVQKMEENGIVEYMVFGPGIQILHK